MSKLKKLLTHPWKYKCLTHSYELRTKANTYAIQRTKMGGMATYRLRKNLHNVNQEWDLSQDELKQAWKTLSIRRDK